MLATNGLWMNLMWHTICLQVSQPPLSLASVSQVCLRCVCMYPTISIYFQSHYYILPSHFYIYNHTIILTITLLHFQSHLILSIPLFKIQSHSFMSSHSHYFRINPVYIGCIPVPLHMVSIPLPGTLGEIHGYPYPCLTLWPLFIYLNHFLKFLWEYTCVKANPLMRTKMLL